MSYYITLTNSTWQFDPEKENEALQVLKTLKYYGGTPMVSEDTQTLDQALQRLDFEVDRFPSYDGENVEVLHIIGYSNRDSFVETILKTLAPFSVDGSEIEWAGEDHTHWKYIVAHGDIVIKYGRIVYDD